MVCQYFLLYAGQHSEQHELNQAFYPFLMQHATIIFQGKSLEIGILIVLDEANSPVSHMHILRLISLQGHSPECPGTVMNIYEAGALPDHMPQEM